jgi:hypothetical protein
MKKPARGGLERGAEGYKSLQSKYWLVPVSW